MLQSFKKSPAFCLETCRIAVTGYIWLDWVNCLLFALLRTGSIKVIINFSSEFCVLQVGPVATHNSAIWPIMDSARRSLLISSFKRIEGILQQHKAMKLAAALEARPAAEVQGQSLLVVTTKLQQMTTSSACSTNTSFSTVPMWQSALPFHPSWEVPEPRVGATECGSCDLETSSTFLTTCFLLSALQFCTFATDEACCNLRLFPAVCSRALLSGQLAHPVLKCRLPPTNHRGEDSFASSGTLAVPKTNLLHPG